MSLLMLIAIGVLATLSAGGLTYALLFDRIQKENTTARRIDMIQGTGRIESPREAAADPAKRRKSIQETLKEVEQREKAKSKHSKSPPLVLRMQQAGLHWSRRTFILISLAVGVVTYLVAAIMGAPI